ncbi:MAG: glutaminyl-peptide cyclotransferase, partial [Verrucomicrobiota bacterium]
PIYVALLSAVAACSPQPPTDADQPTSASSKPQPVFHPHNPQAFTQGLVYHEGLLYESTGLYGKSFLHRFEITSGETLKRRNLDPSHFGEGVTIFDNKIYQLTWKAEVCFVYDLESFALKQRLSYDTQGWGLTHNGSELIMSDGSSYLYFRDPVTFAETKRIQVSHTGRPIEKLNELEYVEGEILANIWYEDRIARIDPATGNINGYLDFSHLLPASERRRLGRDAVLNGIAYNPESKVLYITGKNWPKLFEIPYP